MGLDATLRIVPDQERTEDEVKKLAIRMASVLGPENFWIKPGTGQFALSLEEGGAIEVNWLERYYGIGYERGRLPLILLVAEWLLRNVGGKLYYGPDGEVEEFTKEKRQSLLDWYMENGRLPYVRSDAGGLLRRGLKPERCKWCNIEMIVLRQKFGTGEVSWVCPACDGKTETGNPA